MLLRLSLATGLVVASAALCSSEAVAQTRGTTGQNGQGGNSSSMFSSSAGTKGSSAFGSSGLGSTGQSGFGQTGLGQNGFGQTGQGQGFGQNRTGFGNQNQNNGFLGVNNNPNNFLGRNSQGQPNNLNGQTGNLGRGNQGGNRRQLDPGLQQLLNGGNQNGSGGNGQTQQPVIRPRQKVAFEYPQPKLDAVVTSTQARIQKLAVRYPRLSAVKLAQEADGTIVLTGSAPTEADARVAESMIRLEPGVRKIRNELTFPPPRPENE